MNPLLDFSGLPRFADFAPELVAPAISQLLAETRATAAKVSAGTAEPDWENFVAPLDDAIERLRRAWGQVSHLNAVMNSPQLRQVYNENLTEVTQLFTELAQDEGLARRYKSLRESASYSKLSDAQRKFIDNELRDFRLGGAELASAAKDEFRQNAQRLAELSSPWTPPTWASWPSS